MKLEWKTIPGQPLNSEEAAIGQFDDGDGVRFSLVCYPSCYRRGAWRLLVEVAEGSRHHLWGCFDDQDQPMRYFHSEECARREAQAIANVLLMDRGKCQPALST